VARILLTGATSGIGAAAARLLAHAPHTLVVHGPEPEEKVTPILAELRSVAGADAGVFYVSADFSLADADEQLATGVLEHVDGLDIVINNAGIPGSESLRLGPLGTELTFHVNYLVGTAVTELLLPHIPPTSSSRIINVSSATHYGADLDVDDLAYHRRPYSATAAYARSKLAVLAHSQRLARKVIPTVVSVHPGVISTRLLHAMFGPGGDSVERGGANLANATTAGVSTGTYLDEQRPASPSESATDKHLQDDLHQATERILGRSVT
jgi:NAD(P)-dependent dehydrogenase (short-subunit alcohol dehydrogenase family)